MVKPKLSNAEFRKLLQEARRDPQFHSDIRNFIKITTGVYNLKDYDLN
ncbi:MAG: hypothetical protein AABX37_00135 [Nanoarchaeota archaeon]